MRDEQRLFSYSSLIPHPSSLTSCLLTPATNERRRRPTMAEAKSRSTSIRSRVRKPDGPSADGEAVEQEPERPRSPAELPAVPGEESVPRPQRAYDEDDYAGFDEEINSRYEEIKRGGTHISELQQMTMPQLIKVAKEEGLTDYTGLKKQDLI